MLRCYAGMLALIHQKPGEINSLVLHFMDNTVMSTNLLLSAACFTHPGHAMTVLSVKWTHVQCWHHKSWTVSEIRSNADIHGCPGIIRPNWLHYMFLACQSISDNPWMSMNCQAKLAPSHISCMSRISLTIHGHSGNVTESLRHQTGW